MGYTKRRKEKTTTNKEARNICIAFKISKTEKEALEAIESETGISKSKLLRSALEVTLDLFKPVLERRAKTDRKTRRDEKEK